MCALCAPLCAQGLSAPAWCARARPFPRLCVRTLRRSSLIVRPLCAPPVRSPCAPWSVVFLCAPHVAKKEAAQDRRFFSTGHMACKGRTMACAALRFVAAGGCATRKAAAHGGRGTGGDRAGGRTRAAWRLRAGGRTLCRRSRNGCAVACHVQLAGGRIDPSRPVGHPASACHCCGSLRRGSARAVARALRVGILELHDLHAPKLRTAPGADGGARAPRGSARAIRASRRAPAVRE